MQRRRGKSDPIRVSELKFIPDNSGMKRRPEHEIPTPEREFQGYSGEYRNPELIGNILLREFPEFCGDALQKFPKSIPKSLE